MHCNVTDDRAMAILTHLCQASDQGLHYLHRIYKLLQNMVIKQINQIPLLLEMDRSKELR